MTNVIGLDLSLNSTGVYTCTEAGVFSGVIRPKELRGPARLYNIVKDICYTVNRSGGVQLAVIEDYATFTPRNQRGHMDRAELQGAVRLTLYQAGIDMLLVPPKSLKLFATGNGSAKKDAMIAAARDQGYDPYTDDDADAYFLWKMGCTMLGGRIRCAKRRQAISSSKLIRASKIASVCKID